MDSLPPDCGFRQGHSGMGPGLVVEPGDITALLGVVVIPHSE
jgi:hypothetical protein